MLHLQRSLHLNSIQRGFSNMVDDLVPFDFISIFDSGLLHAQAKCVAMDYLVYAFKQQDFSW